jgi:heme/copper-type cytochrome/quinol oxidase subunit 4
MGVIFQIHSLFGERVLPLLILLTAIYLTVTYKAGAPRTPVARIFPVLVDIQATLGLIYWIFMLISTSGESQARYYSFPFILHPVIGLLAAGLTHWAVSQRNPLARLGRWAPLAALSVLLVLVIANVLIGIQA